MRLKQQPGKETVRAMDILFEHWEKLLEVQRRDVTMYYRKNESLRN